MIIGTASAIIMAGTASQWVGPFEQFEPCSLGSFCARAQLWTLPGRPSDQESRMIQQGFNSVLTFA